MIENNSELELCTYRDYWPMWRFLIIYYTAWLIYYLFLCLSRFRGFGKGYSMTGTAGEYIHRGSSMLKMGKRIRPAAKLRSNIKNPWEILPQEIIREEVIGVGGSGLVYKGTWQKTQVAIKSPHKNIIKKEKQLERYKFEVEILSKLHHPNIILFLGACFSESDVFLVVEFMENGSVYDYIRNPLNEAQLNIGLFINIAMGIARGMKYLHRQNVVQRDLKTGNVLLDQYLNCKINDFGLSHYVNIEKTKENLIWLKRKDESTSSSSINMGGTPYWTAPEILRGEKFNEKCDTFSFGILLWELISRKEPYEDEPEGMVILPKVVFQGYRPKIPSYCPEKYSKLILLCWDQQQEARPSFTEILSFLHEIRQIFSLIRSTSRL